MVVVGIIAILGAVVVPGFKKIYGDFKIMETSGKIDRVLSAIRSAYLIYNEGLDFCGTSYADKRCIPFLPAGYVNSAIDQQSRNDRPIGFYCKGLTTFSQKLYLLTGFCIYRSGGGNCLCLDRHTKPYYFDDLMDRLERMGYTTHRANIEYGYSYVYPPERPGVGWFR